MDATVAALPNLTGSNAASNDRDEHDLIGGPFAVIESDPGVFTTLVRSLGVQSLQVVELYDIEPWASDHLHPIHGLVFCFLWKKDSDGLPKKESCGLEDGEDDSAKLWFANQLSDDACASMAILNVLLNVQEVDIGERLRVFRNETERMSSPMKGLAVSNAHFIRQAHNDLARPADIRGATNVLAIKTLEDAAKAERSMNAPPAKRRKLAAKRKKFMNPEATDANQEEAYHFIGYIPFRGKVWELDGLKSGPVEVGELHSSPSPSGSGSTVHSSWMDIVRPVLRMKMRKYGGGDEETGSIRFNLLAIVEDQFCRASDQLELLKRERDKLETRLNSVYPGGWGDKAGYFSFTSIDSTLLNSSRDVFTTSASFQNPTPPIFAPDFGAQRMARDLQIMNMSPEELLSAWNRCIETALSVKTTVEDELEKPRLANTENIKRTFDYEPFIKEFVRRCQMEGKLAPLLNRRKPRAGAQ
ncbi:cysteine proteinase [Thelephora terrestris]|uniref:ubiquitinyl hydrolase 1 n=1 Tax=Thelephora terrestris TaxID=56493 RepID=A0A9P6L640_9AGAM|nr:cysteine proteinase [Thelephora terrestris]